MNPELPAQVINAMATRAQRMHHYLWHTIRDNWLRYTKDVQQKIAALGWEPPRPAIDANNVVLLTNNSGEDFLYMHRQMIGMVNTILAQVGDPNYPKVEGWTQVPPPGDPDFPVPPAWFDPSDDQADRDFKSLQRVKSDVFYEKRFKMWERMYTDPNFLKGMSLGELGARIEFTIHGSMHMRWAAAPGANRPEPPDASQAETIIPVAWDDPRYNYLGEFYSSHVNPIFWKVHGWVDDRIEGWRYANGVLGGIPWTGTWVGKMPDMPAMAGAPSLHAILADPTLSGSHVQEMEQVVKVIAQSGIVRRPFSLSLRSEP